MPAVEKRDLMPSRATVVGGVSGAAFAPLVVALLVALGVPVTPELGAAIGPALAALAAYFTRGGRRGEPQ